MSNNSQWPMNHEELDRQRADLERLERRRQDPYGFKRAAAAHARDIDRTHLQARQRGENWMR